MNGHAGRIDVARDKISAMIGAQDIGFFFGLATLQVGGECHNTCDRTLHTIVSILSQFPYLSPFHSCVHIDMLPHWCIAYDCA